jgi:hypothetical protein
MWAAAFDCRRRRALCLLALPTAPVQVSELPAPGFTYLLALPTALLALEHKQDIKRVAGFPQPPVLH